MPSVEIRTDTERKPYTFLKVKFSTGLRYPYPFLLVLLVLIICFIGCEGGRYVDKANELVDSIKTVLISENLCKDKNDCSKKQFVFFGAGGGVFISTYGISDPSITNRIAGECTKAHTLNPNIHYKLIMYSLTKEEDYRSSKQKKIILTLDLPKEN
jgi:hypothetical protein